MTYLVHKTNNFTSRRRVLRDRWSIMDHVKKLILTTLLVLSLTAALSHQAPARQLCDWCDCMKVNDIVKTVKCECSKQQNLIISKDTLHWLTHITSFTVSNCESVVFNQSSFGDCHDLDDVKVSNASRVVFPPGVFAVLGSLTLEDISDLRLMQSAFVGAENIREVAIRRSNISALSSYSLFNVKGLHKVELTGVIVGVVNSKAISVSMMPDSEFVIHDCEIHSLEEDAIRITTGLLNISTSNFIKVSREAVKVSSGSILVDIRTSIFGKDFADDGFILEADQVNFVANLFNTLPLGLFQTHGSSNRKFIFNNNTISNFPFYDPNVNLDNFLDNRIPHCSCKLFQSILLEPETTAAFSERMLCSFPNCSVPLKRLLEGSVQLCKRDKEPTESVGSSDAEYEEEVEEQERKLLMQECNTLAPTVISEIASPPTTTARQSRVLVTDLPEADTKPTGKFIPSTDVEHLHQKLKDTSSSLRIGDCRILVVAMLTYLLKVW